jgi:hypothetical protein
MRKDEVVKKNIGLTFDFLRAAVADPHLLDKIPDGAEIEFLETDLPRIEPEERTDMEKLPVLFKVERNFQMILINRDRNLFYFNRVPAPLLLPIK